MGIKHLIIGLCVLPHVAYADIPPLACAGSTVDWSLTLDADTAQFKYLDRDSTLDIMQQSVAEGATWPIAMTAIGPRDSAIIILEDAVQDTHPVRVLTQRGETPILLAGLCRPAE